MNFHLPFSELLTERYSQLCLNGPNRPYRLASNSEKGRWKLIFSSVYNIHTICFQILSCTTLLQFARVSLLFWAPVQCLIQIEINHHQRRNFAYSDIVPWFRLKPTPYCFLKSCQYSILFTWGFKPLLNQNEWRFLINTI